MSEPRPLSAEEVEDCLKTVATDYWVKAGKLRGHIDYQAEQIATLVRLSSDYLTVLMERDALQQRLTLLEPLVHELAETPPAWPGIDQEWCRFCGLNTYKHSDDCIWQRARAACATTEEEAT
jgi:hypothetical protein